MTTATPVQQAPAERFTAATNSVAGDPAGAVEDAFALEVHVISDVRRDLMPSACDTSDGCRSTCASSCTST